MLGGWFMAVYHSSPPCNNFQDDPIITLAWNPIEIKQIGAHEAERRH
jgi:hypothetical protein